MDEAEILNLLLNGTATPEQDGSDESAVSAHAVLDPAKLFPDMFTDTAKAEPKTDTAIQEQPPAPPTVVLPDVPDEHFTPVPRHVLAEKLADILTTDVETPVETRPDEIWKAPSATAESVPAEDAVPAEESLSAEEMESLLRELDVEATVKSVHASVTEPVEEPEAEPVEEPEDWAFDDEPADLPMQAEPAAVCPTPAVYSPLDMPTQVISLEDDSAITPDDGQMTMDDFAPETVEETVPEEEQSDWEEQLMQTRREQIRDFQIQQNRESQDFRYADDVAPDEKPEAEPADTAEESTPSVAYHGDFTAYEQAEDIRAELSHRYRTGKFRFWLAVIAEVLLICSDISVAYYGQPTVTPSLFLVLNSGLLVCMALIFFAMLRDGAAALWRLRPTADTVPFLTALAALIHAVAQWGNLTAVEEGNVPLFTSLAGMSLLFCAIGRLAKLNRIRQNFAMVSKEREKYAAMTIEEEHAAVEIGRPAVAMGIPRVALFHRVDFLDDFLANSYMKDRYDTVLHRFVPIILGVSVLLGIVAGVLGGVYDGLTAFALTLCTVSPAASLALNVPLLTTCRKLLKNGNLICSYAAAERFGHLHGVALDVSDLYRQDSVALHGIRTFGDTRIDEAIMDAAALAIRTEGPLAGLFLRIIEDKTDILPAAENIIFEQEMGFSGWVGGRRVLVGNRKLLENHGVDTPSGDYENRYKRGGRELVYLSVGGELSAMFIISYLADETVETSLHRLQAAKVSLLVRSCDPNVTETSLCSGFALDGYYLDLLTASAGRLYDNLRKNTETHASAGAAVNGTVTGMADLLAACRRLRKRGLTAIIVQLVMALFGAVWCAGAVLGGTVPPAPATVLFAVISAMLSLLLPLLVK